MCEPLPSSPALPHAGGQAKKGRKRVPGRGNGLGLGKPWQPKSLHGENQTKAVPRSYGDFLLQEPEPCCCSRSDYTSAG